MMNDWTDPLPAGTAETADPPRREEPPEMGAAQTGGAPQAAPAAEREPFLPKAEPGPVQAVPTPQPPRTQPEAPGELQAITVLAEIQPVLKGSEEAPDGREAPPTFAGVDPRDIQELLADSVGRYLICEFLIGSHQLIRREGILVRVGCSFFVLYEEQSNTQVLCNLYTAKFITILPQGQHPQEQPRQPQSRVNGLYPPMQAQQMPGQGQQGRRQPPRR